MIAADQIVKIVTEELTKLKREQHWGELVIKIPLKNGDPQQLSVGYEKTFRQPGVRPQAAHP